MQIIEKMTKFSIEGPSAVAIGKFDGIHRGHRKLLEDLYKEKEKGKKTVIFTFDPSPASFFAGETVPGLMTKEEKRQVFLENGIDVLVEFPMNKETAAIPADVFVRKYLVEQMNAKYVVAGLDVSFGDKGKGDWNLLQSLGHELGFETHFIKKVECNGREISSTYVREEITNGNMENAAFLLGFPYTFSGVVKHGRALGRTIGIPTINIVPDKEKILPPNGVYFSKVQIGNKTYKGMTNVGCKPTVDSKGEIVIETFIYDFKEDVYDEDVSVSLLKFRRPEKKFADINELKEQMEKDLAAGKEYEIPATMLT